MKEYPFEDPGVGPSIVRKHREMFDAVRSEVMVRMKGRSETRDKRVGFGTLAAVGDLRPGMLALSMWKWRDADPDEYPGWTDAAMFSDDPLTVPPDASLGTRMALAEQFAEVAAGILDPEKATFKARAIEIVAAGPGRQPGLEPGEDADVLTIELYEGVPVPRIIDRLVQIEADRAGCVTRIYAGFHLQVRLWHRAERINAARAMLGRELPPIRIPGIPALEKRIDRLTDAKIESDRERPEQPTSGRDGA